MIFDKLSKKYLDDAVNLAKSQYNMQQKYIESLYEKNYTVVLTNLILETFNKNYGVIAIDKGKVIGYLSFIGPINNQFGNIKGSFSPLHANAYGGDDRSKLVAPLFQHASKKMIKEEILSYAICVYSYDIEVITSLSMNGFNLRCSGAIRNLNIPLDVPKKECASPSILHPKISGVILTHMISIAHFMKLLFKF